MIDEYQSTKFMMLSEQHAPKYGGNFVDQNKQVSGN